MTVVYFARLRRVPSPLKIKIGCTGNLKTRLRSLSWEYEEAIELLATMQGGFEEERIMHFRFNHLRFRSIGDWFFPTPEIYEAMGRPDLYVRPPDNDISYFMTEKRKQLAWLLRMGIEGLRDFDRKRAYCRRIKEASRPDDSMRFRLFVQRERDKLASDIRYWRRDIEAIRREARLIEELAGLLSRRRQDQGVKTRED